MSRLHDFGGMAGWLAVLCNANAYVLAYLPACLPACLPAYRIREYVHIHTPCTVHMMKGQILGINMDNHIHIHTYIQKCNAEETDRQTGKTKRKKPSTSSQLQTPPHPPKRKKSSKPTSPLPRPFLPPKGELFPNRPRMAVKGRISETGRGKKKRVVDPRRYLH